MVYFDVCTLCAGAVFFPALEGMMVCDVVMREGEVFVGGVQQLAVLNLRTGSVRVIDFFAPLATKISPVITTLEKQRKLAGRWKGRMSIPQGQYSGNLRLLPNKLEVVTGALYTKHQYSLLFTQSKSAIEDCDTLEETKYVLLVTKLSYVKGEVVVVGQKAIGVGYSFSQLAEVRSEPFLVVRTSRNAQTTLVAFNFFNQAHSRILLFNTDAAEGVQFRPSDFLLDTDSLPSDRYGRISLLITAIEWTPDDLYAVVLFSNSYFCILSCLGQPLQLLREGLAAQFCVLPVSNKDNYTSLKVTNTRIISSNANASVVVEYESKIPVSELWIMGKSEMSIDKLLKLVLAVPHLAVDTEFLSMIKEAMNVKNCLNEECLVEWEKKEVAERESEVFDFTNPFPLEPSIEAHAVLRKLSSAIESLRWSLDVPNGILETLHGELNNQGGLLLLKNEPVCLIHMLELYKSSIKHLAAPSSSNQIAFYSLSAAFNSIATKSFNLEKQFALLVFYCLIQLRNKKATSFNVVYILIADMLMKKYKTRASFSASSKEIMNTLKATAFSERAKKTGFFDTNVRAILNFKGQLYQAMFEVCDELRAEEACTITEEMSETAKAKLLSTRQCSRRVMSTLISAYELNETKSAAKCLNYKVVGNIDNIITCDEDCYMYNLYSCAVLINTGRFDTAFKEIKKLLSESLEEDSSSKGSLAFITGISCLLMSIVTIMKGKERCGIRLCEVPTFFYKVLKRESLCKAVEELEQIIHKPNLEVGMLHSIPLDCSNSQREVYTVTGILMQLSEHELAIDLLVNSEDSTFLLLALLILNKKLNESIRGNNTELMLKYMQILVCKIRLITEKYPMIKLNAIKFKTQHTIENPLSSNILSNFILVGSRVAGALAAYAALPYFIFQLQQLLQIADLDPMKIISKSEKNCFNAQPCLFIEKVTKEFSGCSAEVCQVFLNKYFCSAARASVFTHLLQEAAQILSSCLQKGVISYVPRNGFKKETIKLLEEFPKELADKFRSRILKLLQFIWQVVLLHSIEELNATGNDPVLKSLKLAGYLMRLSFAAKTEQQELEFIQQGMNALKAISHSKGGVPECTEEIKMLGNAFEVYAEKWDAALRAKKEEVFALIDSKNLTALRQLKGYMVAKKSLVELKSSKKTFRQLLHSDVLCFQLVKILKEISDADCKKNKTTLLKIEEMGKNLKRAVSWSQNMTGMPRGTAVDRRGLGWTLRKDSCHENSGEGPSEKCASVGNTLKLLNFGKANEFQDIGRHYSIVGDMGTYRIFSASSSKVSTSPHPCNTINSTLLILQIENRNFAKSKALNLSSFNLINYERGISKLISTLSQRLSLAKRTMQLTQPNPVSKVTLRPLVPICSRGFQHKKSKSFVVRDTSMRPFALYSVRKDQLQSTGVSTENASCSELRLPTEEVPAPQREQVSVGCR